MPSEQNVTERQQLRTNLKCHSFDWYLRNVWPDHFLPTSERFFGKVMLVDQNSKLYSDYLDVIKDADSSLLTDWKYIIKLLTDRADAFKVLTPENVMYCLQQPHGHGVLNQPSRQTHVKNCKLLNFAQESFVIKNDGHVSIGTTPTVHHSHFDKTFKTFF